MKEKMIVLTLTLFFTLLASQVVMSDDDDDEGRGFLSRAPGVTPVTNDLYKEECGSCHFAYPPGLLPSASWEKVMAGLEDHFGDNAELLPDTHKTLLAYLSENSAVTSGPRRESRIARSAAAKAPLRITEVPYIRREHDEIPNRMIKANAKVGSLSNCNACHTRAEAGSFREREIRIPGHGRWDD